MFTKLENIFCAMHFL